MSNTWNHLVPTLSWAALSKEVRPHLGKVRRYGVDHVAADRAAIVAYYDSVKPQIAPFVITLDGLTLTIEVRTAQLPPPLESFPVNVGSSGLYPGAGIIAQVSQHVTEAGAVCVLLAPPDADRPSHLLTCGHMFPPGAQHTPVLAAGHGAQLEQIGRLLANLLEASHGQRIDVAVVELLGPGITMALAGGPGPAVEDYLPADDVIGFPAHSFRPTQGQYSDEITTKGPFTEHVDARLWPGGFEVTNVIGTSTAIADLGDSGTILTTLDDPPIAIGICSATDTDMTLFEPVGRALQAIGSLGLQIWRRP
jgi:hypothetical protein